ncbi:MAG: WG repeat-containing protein [Clostridia bacterium]|nr:WG repeat-containing protein [Clostridia bacterium]
MNLIDESSQEVKKGNKKGKGLIISMIVVLVLLLAVTSALIYLLNQEEQKVFKFNLDGNQVTISQSFLYVDGEKEYISIKELAEILGYKVYNGGYKEYTEDLTKCYIQNKNEIVEFTANSKEYFKINPNATEDYQNFSINGKVLQTNDLLYIPIDDISIAFNCSSSKKGNNLIIESLEYLAQQYTVKYSNAKFTEYDDMKAILYGVIIIQDENSKLGLITLQGDTIVGVKYSNIEFYESTQEFYITTAEGKKGIIDIEGKTKVIPTYDEIHSISKDLQLYVVLSGGKYGIINSKNEIVLYIEYDMIGIQDVDRYHNIKNQYLIYDKIIPICKEDKWGFIDTQGNFVLPMDFDNIGCMVNTNVAAAKDVVLIDEYKAIVVGKDDYYGIINTKGEFLIPLGLTSVYSTTTSGKTTYSMVYQEQVIDTLDYLKQTYLDEETSVDNTQDQMIQENNTEDNE